MLSVLHIENIAVIESAEIVWGGGLNLLTGETGAGKSIITMALGAVIGLRTSRELVRTGASSARVSAVFDNLSPDVYALLDSLGFSLPEGEELLITREISAEGRNICRIGGKPATLTVLRELGEALLQIHGQHDTRALLDGASHRALLDAFGQLQPLLAQYKQAYGEWRALAGELDALQLDERQREAKIAELEETTALLSQAELSVEEEDYLAQRREFLRNADRIRGHVGQALALLQGDGDYEGAADAVSLSARLLSELTRYSAGMESLLEQANAVSDQLQDLSGALADTLESLEGDESEGEDVEQRLDQIYRLKRRYGRTVGELLAYLAACEQDLDILMTYDSRLAGLTSACAQAQDRAQTLARQLHDKREQAGRTLSLKVCEELTGLDMDKARFAVSCEPAALGVHGMDSVSFLLSANPGEEPRPLSKIASGGELSRIMLAIKNVLGEQDDCTLVFDEIDTGVSGRAAARVAEKLGRLSCTRQVICVTHLPQIAAMADTHFHIEKGVEGERTFTRITALDETGRIEELARLTGGLTITDTVRKSAAELIKTSRAVKTQDKETRKR